jgi:hypothetical protein
MTLGQEARGVVLRSGKLAEPPAFLYKGNETNRPIANGLPCAQEFTGSTTFGARHYSSVGFRIEPQMCFLPEGLAGPHRPINRSAAPIPERQPLSIHRPDRRRMPRLCCRSQAGVKTREPTLRQHAVANKGGCQGEGPD